MGSGIVNRESRIVRAACRFERVLAATTIDDARLTIDAFAGIGNRESGIARAAQRAESAASAPIHDSRLTIHAPAGGCP
jgi:hypothetical protein